VVNLKDEKITLTFQDNPLKVPAFNLSPSKADL